MSPKEAGGATKHNEAYERERYDHAAEDIERLLDKMAEKAACEQLENERTRELNDVAQSISYGDVHAGVDICVNRYPPSMRSLPSSITPFPDHCWISHGSCRKASCSS